MIERCTELAREWNIPVFIAQLDLKKEFDRISHDSIAEMLCSKNLCPQLVAVLCSWWCCSSLEVRLGHVTSDRCISVDPGVPQGAPESPLVFVMVADEILGGSRAGRGGTSHGRAMQCPSAAWDTQMMYSCHLKP